MIELTRDLKQYLDVETFEEYEFTSCIAYEMAIRNDEVVNIIKYRIKNINDPFMLEEYQLVAIDLPNMHLQYHFFKMHELKSFVEIQKEVSRRLMFNKPGIIYQGFVVENEVENVKLSHGLNIEDELDGFSKPCIIQKFSRPILRAPPKMDKTVDICNLNLALPKRELVAYIMRIKDQYDDYHDVVKAPLEAIVGIFDESNFERKNGVSALDWADALFIYDYWKLHDEVKSDLEIIAGIIIELNEYHRNNGSTWRKYKGKDAADYLSDSTIRLCRKMMIDYIDNLRYKELLTGISA
ncbi:MAG: hypothetical protein M1300_06470 [Epsilonproteobacteria bacterium]|nr:hypothetical protein [Campylobacterota bacterium]